MGRLSPFDRLAQQVPPQVRAQGEREYALDHIEFEDYDDDLLVASFRGSETWRIALEPEFYSLNASCTCRNRVDEDSPCSHIWATIIMAEAALRFGASAWKKVKELVVLPAALCFPELRETPLPGHDHGPAGHMTTTENYSAGTPSRASNEARTPIPSAMPPSRGSAYQGFPPPWEGLFSKVEVSDSRTARPIAALHYAIDAEASVQYDRLVVELVKRPLKKTGTWGRATTIQLDRFDPGDLADPVDREVVELLFGSSPVERWRYSYLSSYRAGSALGLSAPQANLLLPRICATGRAWVRFGKQRDPIGPLKLVDIAPWRLEVAIHPLDGSTKHGFGVAGALRRGEERLSLSAPLALLPPGLVVFDDRIEPMEWSFPSSTIDVLRRTPQLEVPEKVGFELATRLLTAPQPVHLDLAEPLRLEVIDEAPRPFLVIKRQQPTWRQSPEDVNLRGELSFDYRGERVGARTQHPAASDRRRIVVKRRTDCEVVFEQRLRALGFKPDTIWSRETGKYLPVYDLKPAKLPAAVAALAAEGWQVEAEGNIYRSRGIFKIEITSGIDWFELNGEANFDGATVEMPELLAALRRGDKMIRLRDGSFGLLPDEWLRRYGPLADLGEAADGHVRFQTNQIALLDALLADEKKANWDETFEKARGRLAAFHGIRPAKPGRAFRGKLRDYQHEGLGWLRFLEDFGFGGCLADDMGLGKTVQVLAHLASRAAPAGKDRMPSLLVVPNSLVFNWKEEAARFAPKLGILDHTGASRGDGSETFAGADLVITTYGTLRNDINWLAAIEFDYCILDEAQAIKNATSLSAKAARRIQAKNRLAMSGTPIENHLGELWSLFEFLNPGMLGRAAGFGLSGSSRRPPEGEGRELLARALRPYILRRTKSQVASELPERTEQTLFCELPPVQRKLYDELRLHYRQVLSGALEGAGANRQSFRVLEALLRLRQAACHPGLLDEKRKKDGSAKFDTLVPMLSEIVDEGNKALVFSQFTSLLGLLRTELDAAGIPYDYLDGQTADRRKPVDSFQNSSGGRLFLISLKAGGVGLNLTAAEYVFLLDPWWNPAVEAQAIDRTHRIGQTRKVFAYRLVAKDTVEEKILELQKTKRALVEAVIREDDRPLASLTREDLALLLS